jgi:hypothetical protein
VFSFKNGATPISAFSRAKAELDAAMTIELEAAGREFRPFGIHDIRRSCRTWFSRLGIAEHIGERLLAHTQGELDRRYNLYGFEPEKRAALERWHSALEDIIEGRQAGSNVVSLRA